MKTIQLTFLFEDTGFCKDVFQSVNRPYYYCNRDTVDGTWYTSRLPSRPYCLNSPSCLPAEPRRKNNSFPPSSISDKQSARVPT